MADFHERVIIEVQVDPRSAAQQAQTAVSQVLQAFNQLRNQRISLGAPEIAPFQQALQGAVTKAVDTGIKSSSAYQSLATTQSGQPVYGGRVAQAAILGTTLDGPGSALFEARSKLTRALIRQEQIQNEINKRTGGLYDTPVKRQTANQQAAEQVSAAQRGVVDQYKRLATEIATELGRRRKEVDAELTARGQLITTLNRQKAVVEAAAAREAAQARSRQEAEGRATIAIQRRAALETAAARALQEADARAILALNKRAQVDQEAGRAAQFDQTFQTPYPNADLSTRAGRAESSVNTASRGVVTAQEKLAGALNSETANVARTNAARRGLETAERNLAAAEERLAIQTGHVGTSFLEQFRTGFSGQSHRPYAEQIGQAFKFSVFYGAAYRLLDGITQTFAQTLQEGIQFQQAVSELVIATGRTEDEITGLANTLGQRASEVGFAPSAGVLVGARSLGLYGVTDAQGGNKFDQAAIADMSARIVSRLAFTSGQQPADLQTNIAAIVNAFGGGPEAQFRVADLDAYMSHFFGTAPGSTIQSVSEAGTVGRAAGFSLEEVSAIAADLQARTGQTAPAVAGFMAQIFSRGGEGALTSVAQRYGIDPTLELSKQVEKLAEIYKDAAPQQQAQIAAAFGRGKVQNAAVSLLQDYASVQEAARQASGGAATGAADKQTQLRLSNIGGQIQVTIGALREFANQLSQSGVLQVLGAFILVARETVEALTGMLRIWNQVPGAVKGAVIALGLLAAAARTSAVQQALSGRFGTVVQGTRYVEAVGGGTVAAGSAAGARGLLTSTLGGLVNPVTSAIAGLIAIGALKNKADELGRTLDITSRTRGLGAGASVDDLRSHAAALDAAAGDSREASNGILARFINFGANRSDNLQAAAAAEREADRLRAVSELAAASQPEATRQLITGFDVQSLTESMSQITNNGGTAAERLDALAASINGTADAAARARETFNPQLFAGDNAQGVQRAAAQAGAASQSGGIFEYSPGFIKGFLQVGQDHTQDPNNKNILPDLIREQLSQSDVQKRLQDAVASLTSLDDIDAKTADSIARSVLGDTAAQIGAAQGLDQGAIDTLQQSMIDTVSDYIEVQVQGVKAVVNGTLRFTPDQLVAILDQAVADVTELTGNLPQTDYQGRIDAFRSALRTARTAASKTVGDELPKALQDMAQLRILLSNAEIDRLEALRSAQQHSAGSKAEYVRIGQSFLRREIRNAANAGNTDRLAAIISAAGDGAVAIAKEAIKEAIKVARAAQKVAYQAQQAAAALATQVTSFFGAQNLVPDVGAFEFQNPFAGFDLGTVTPAGEGNDYTGSYDPGGGGGGAPKETALEKAAAAAQARAIRSESPIQQARADVLAARAAMDKAKKGTVEYYNALGSYYAARNALTDAILDYKRNKYLLGIDITDPVQQAEVDLRVARDKLRSDAGKGKDVRAADQVAVRQAEADLEAQKFQQRLQTVQTAEDLGRISHRKYIAYLDHERDRLEAIKNRTFQQQDQLNQIDSLLQEAAASMDAQFNLGDIKLPTVYQVRRTIAETAGTSLNDRSRSSLNAAPVDNSQTTITVYGADAEWVLSMIDKAAEKPGRTLTAKSRRRI